MKLDPKKDTALLDGRQVPDLAVNEPLGFPERLRASWRVSSLERPDPHSCCCLDTLQNRENFNLKALPAFPRTSVNDCAT